MWRSVNEGGVIFGAAFDEEFNVRHRYAETIETCEKFNGSKYVQSKIGSTFKEAKKFLEECRIVLFSGTQCQIKGLNLFLRKTYDNLITVDVTCHGVPSSMVFDKYKMELENKNNSKIETFKFKDESIGWHKSSIVVEFNNGNKYFKTLNEGLYMRGFLKNLYLRPSCYECKDKNFTSGSDISLADYWGVEKIQSEFDDDMGISLALVNNQRGCKLISLVLTQIDSVEVKLKDILGYNPCIINSAVMNGSRRKFF